MESQIKPVVDQATIIARNVLRWQQEQEKKKEKREKLAKLASLKGISVPQLLTQRRERWLLKSCRATIGEIVQKHGKEVK